MRTLYRLLCFVAFGSFPFWHSLQIWSYGWSVGIFRVIFLFILATSNWLCHWKVIKILLDRGAVMPTPHHQRSVNFSPKNVSKKSCLTSINRDLEKKFSGKNASWFLKLLLDGIGANFLISLAYSHRHYEERGQWMSLAPPLRSKIGPFREVVFHENISLESPSLDQKEQNFFGLKFFSSFALMLIVEMTGRVTAISG